MTKFIFNVVLGINMIEISYHPRRKNLCLVIYGHSSNLYNFPASFSILYHRAVL